MKRQPWLWFLVLLGFGALAGCSKPSTPMTPQPMMSGYGNVSLQITDAPAMFDHVNLDVSAVWVHRLDDGTPGDTLGDCDSTRGDSHGYGVAERGRHHGRREHGDRGTWIELAATPGIIDVLALQDGVFATLGADSVPAGNYDQIKLVLGTDNTIVIDGVSAPLVVPGESRLGYHLVGRFMVPVSGGADIGIDFDAARSIRQDRSGDWVLRPIVRIIPLTDTGKIAGSLAPARARAWLFALQGADTVASTREHGGHFTLSLLPAGDYTVAIAPASGFRDTSLTGVSVAIHRTTDLGTIVLTPSTTTPVASNATGATRR